MPKTTYTTLNPDSIPPPPRIKPNNLVLEASDDSTSSNKGYAAKISDHWNNMPMP